MLKSLGRRLLAPMLGRRRFQRAFELLYEVSLAGLNVGEGKDPRRSGERFVVEFVAKRVGARQAVIFDVGANVGTYTRELLEILPPTARILAFEPAPSAFRLLEANLAGEGRVELRNLGFSDDERQALLYSPAPASKVASLYKHGSSGSSDPERATEEARFTTLDDFCWTQAIRRIDFLKLDVEGHELKVLLGGQKLLDQGSIGAIQFEFGRANIGSRTFFWDFHELLNDRYQLFRVLRNDIRPIRQYAESHETFRGATNYLAVLKTPVARFE